MTKSVIADRINASHICNIKTQKRKKIRNKVLKRMKNLIYIFTWVWLFVGAISSAQAQSGWLKRYGNSDNTSAQAVARTADGGYFFCGFSEGSTRLYLVKTDAEGSVLATNSYLTAQPIRENVKMTDGGDGTFYLAFATNLAANNPKNISLVKVSQNCKKLKEWNFGDSTDRRIGDIKRLADGNFIILTTKYTFNGDSAAILKTDPQGTTIFSKTVALTTTNRNATVRATTIVEAQDRSIYYSSSGASSDTARLFKLDKDGTPLSTTVIPTLLNGRILTYIESLAFLTDGNLAFAGKYAGIMSVNGVNRSLVSYRGRDDFYREIYPTPLIATADGGFAMVGSHDTLVVNFLKFLLKINANGATTFSKDIEVNSTFTNGVLHTALVETKEGGFVVASEQVSGGSLARLLKIGSDAVLTTNEVSGYVFYDANSNCNFEFNEKPYINATVEISNGAGKIYRTRPDSTGFYTTTVERGTYDVRLLDVPATWNTSDCADVVSFTDDYGLRTRNLGLKPKYTCPQLEVNVSTAVLRRCATSVYKIRYGNNGATTANNAFVDVQLDSLLNFQGATLPIALQGNRVFRFNVGNLKTGEYGSFEMKIAPACGDSTKDGQTLCVQAHIYPDSTCVPTVGWSGGKFQVQGRCDIDAVRFLVKNVGTSDAGLDVQSVVIQDQVLFLKAPTVTLPPNAVFNFSPDAPHNGSTYRAKVPQVPNAPGNSRPTIAIEGCGRNGANDYSRGFVNQFPEDDADAFMDKECQILRGGAVGSELDALPVGYRAQHQIEQADEIEYMIRFRNTTNDTAFVIEIRDTLSDFLDPTSVELGASSQSYRFELFGKNILKFTFLNANVPPTRTDSINALGFLKFRVKLMAKVPNGTLILNNACVNMNFGSDVATNQTFHTLGKNFILTAIIDPTTASTLSVKVYPNPFSEVAVFDIENEPLSTNSTFTLFDIMGRRLRTERFDGNHFTFHREDLPIGVYVFKIEDHDGRRLATGKIVATQQ